MYQTHRRWWTVADAAQLLRVHTDTLYDACADGSFPHMRVGGVIKIPCEALRMQYVPVEPPRKRYDGLGNFVGYVDPYQLELPLDPACLIPIRKYRDGTARSSWDYERSLWGHNKK